MTDDEKRRAELSEKFTQISADVRRLLEESRGLLARINADLDAAKEAIRDSSDG